MNGHRMIVCLIATLMTGTLLFASGQKDSGSAASEGEMQEVTVEVYYPVAVDAPIADILDGYIEEFESANPNITIEPVYSGGYADVKTAVQTTIQGGGTPPALGVMLATDLYDLVNAGYITPMDPFLEEMENSESYLNDFYPTFLENSRYDGRLWSIPFQRSAVVMYYNADLLSGEGLSRPTSRQSLAETAEALTERSGGETERWGIEWPSGWPYWLFQPLAIGAGQNIVGSDPTEVFFDAPEVVDAIEYYNSLSEEYNATPAGVQGSWGAAPSNFASGNTAMIVHSSGSLTGILEQADFEVGVMPIPGREEGSYASVPGGGNLYMMDGVSEAQQEAAFRFVRFLTQPARAADFSIQTGYIASRRSSYETDAMSSYIDEVPQAAQTRDALQYAGKELAVQNLGEVRDIFHQYLQAAFNREMSPQEAMEQAQQEADSALEPFRE